MFSPSFQANQIFSKFRKIIPLVHFKTKSNVAK